MAASVPPTAGANPALMNCLNDIEAAAATLRNAMLKRNVTGMWDAITAQEDNLQRLASFQSRLAATGPATDEERTLADRIRGILRTNYSMAAAFLDVMNRTMDGLSRQEGGPACTYNRFGRVGYRAAPVLVHNQG